MSQTNDLYVQQLDEVVGKRFGTQSCSYIGDLAQVYVLHCDYGLSPLEVAKYKLREEIEVCRALREFENFIAVGPVVFANHLTAMRVFFYFALLQFNDQYRAAALLQTREIRTLCGDEFGIEVLTMLGWSHHQIVELDTV